MKKRWGAALANMGMEDTAFHIFHELETLYAEPHRKYHNLEHIQLCLELLDSHPHTDVDAASLEMAIWFHDAIYAPLRHDNEEVSAAMAIRCLAELGANACAESGRSVRFQQSVHRLIMCTTHDKRPSAPDEALMIDIDLAILGSDQTAFAAYESAIRYEYRVVPAPFYRRKRKAILRAFLARDFIYNTPPFVESREELARLNLEWAISKL